MASRWDWNAERELNGWVIVRYDSISREDAPPFGGQRRIIHSDGVAGPAIVFKSEAAAKRAAAAQNELLRVDRQSRLRSARIVARHR